MVRKAPSEAKACTICIQAAAPGEIEFKVLQGMLLLPSYVL